jgi:hypothetical protein
MNTQVMCPVMAAMALPCHAMAEDPSLSSLCLDLCRHLASVGKEFTFSLTVDKFSFSIDSKEEARNKNVSTPSTTTEPEPESEEKEERKFQCHSCGYQNASRVAMEEHIKNVHKTASSKQ